MTFLAVRSEVSGVLQYDSQRGFVDGTVRP